MDPCDRHFSRTLTMQRIRETITMTKTMITNIVYQKLMKRRRRRRRMRMRMMMMRWMWPSRLRTVLPVHHNHPHPLNHPHVLILPLEQSQHPLTTISTSVCPHLPPPLHALPPPPPPPTTPQRPWENIVDHPNRPCPHPPAVNTHKNLGQTRPHKNQGQLTLARQLNYSRKCIENRGVISTKSVNFLGLWRRSKSLFNLLRKTGRCMHKCWEIEQQR